MGSLIKKESQLLKAILDNRRPIAVRKGPIEFGNITTCLPRDFATRISQVLTSSIDHQETTQYAFNGSIDADSLKFSSLQETTTSQPFMAAKTFGRYHAFKPALTNTIETKDKLIWTNIRNKPHNAKNLYLKLFRVYPKRFASKSAFSYGISTVAGSTSANGNPSFLTPAMSVVDTEMATSSPAMLLIIDTSLQSNA